MSYRVAYRHDGKGNALDGSLQILIDAVLNGRKVRVLVEDDKRGHSYVFDGEFLFAQEDFVCAQNTSIISVDQDEDMTLRFKEKCYKWLLIACTKGYVDITRYNLGENTRVQDKEHTREHHTMRWFIDE
jgi:hypothetical protein